MQDETDLKGNLGLLEVISALWRHYWNLLPFNVSEPSLQHYTTLIKWTNTNIIIKNIVGETKIWKKNKKKLYFQIDI